MDIRCTSAAASHAAIPTHLWDKYDTRIKRKKCMCNRMKRTLIKLQKPDISLDNAAAIETAEAPVRIEGRTKYGRDTKKNIKLL